MMHVMKQSDVIIVGAGAAGLMCAREAALRGKRVTVLEHSARMGEKIRISGGGRCNFTNLYARPETFLSQNPHFCKSALSRYTAQDFLDLVKAHHIGWHEKPYEDNAHQSAKGQLFCDDKAFLIIDMLRNDAQQAGVKFHLETDISNIEKDGDFFIVTTNKGDFKSAALVIASGGLSIPKIGASPFGYKVAAQFELSIIPPRAGLVPLTFADSLLAQTKELSGIGLQAEVKSEKGGTFTEGLLFTHRGLSGPSILQISSYWREGEEITVNLLPGQDMFEALRLVRREKPKQKLHNILCAYLPKKLAVFVAETSGHDVTIADLSDKKLRAIADSINDWHIKPQGSEGYRTAEVTLGGVDTGELSSKTMEVKKVPGLYFIGEIVDVTGHLGGHNFQWAWSSAVAAGQAV